MESVRWTLIVALLGQFVPAGELRAAFFKSPNVRPTPEIVVPARLEAGRPVPAEQAALETLGAELSSGQRPPDRILEKTFDEGNRPAASAEPVSVPPAPAAPSPRLSLARRLVNQLPNAATAASIGLGLKAAHLAARGGDPWVCAKLILLAAAFDGIDGFLARALKVNNPLGIDKDSLADFFAFGAAPALLLYQAYLRPLGWAGFGAALAFTLAGWHRLSRFNVGARQPRPRGVKPSFTGMPIPAGAGLVAALAAAAPHLPSTSLLWTSLGVALLAAVAMASRLPYPAPLKALSPRGLAALGGTVLAGSAALWAAGLPWLVPAAVFGGFALSGPAWAARRAWVAGVRRG